MDENGDDDEAHKPRRLDDDTVTYLTQLDVQLSAEDLDSEDREILVENVLSEIKLRTASAACDRRTNMIIEKLCYAASLPHLIEIINRCTPYAVFLARNRHSSHILQAILARLCYILKNHGIGNVNEEELKKSVLGFLKLILNEISWLVKELSASHVVRSALCALAGIPIISERKGKGSKHQHSVSLSEPLDTLVMPGKFYIKNSVSFGVPEEFHDCLGEAVVSLISLGSQDIQSMIADSSSCAVLGLLLRILYSPDIIQGGCDLAERLARIALECPQPVTTKSNNLLLLKANPAAVTLFYAMAGDRSGSYFLEAVLECCAIPLLIELLHGALQGSAKEYAQDGAGNFVLQAVLKRISAELERRDMSSPELHALEAVADSLLSELTAEELFIDLALSKGGVVLWLLELARWTECKKGSTDWAEVVGGGLISAWTNKGSMQLPNVLAGRLAPKAAQDELAASAQPPKKVNGRVVVDRNSAQLLIARLIGALLKLSDTAPVSKSAEARASALVAQAVFVLPADTLKYVATSGPLSRAILDTVLDQYEGSDPSKASKASTGDVSVLLANLTTLSVDLADHFIGQHVLKRVFDKGSAADKENIVTALDSAKENLGRTKEGRNSLRIVQAELFARKPDEWRALLRKQSAALDMLKEIEGSTGGRQQSQSSSSAAGEKQRKGGFDKPLDNYSSGGHGGNSFTDSKMATAVEEDEEAAGTGSRKRKRKRPGKKNAEEGADAPAEAPVKHEVSVKPEKSVPSSSSVSAPVEKSAVPIKVAISAPKAAQPVSTERNIDMRKIQRLRSGKVTSLVSLGDEIERLAKKPSTK